jgi:hypothetical protein
MSTTYSAEFGKIYEEIFNRGIPHESTRIGKETLQIKAPPLNLTLVRDIPDT